MAGISSVENNKNGKWNEGERRSKYMKINLSASSSVNNIEIITKNPTSENCFAFNSTIGEITQYYYYENNDNTQPSCPMDVIIPSAIDSVPVTSIGNFAFKNNNLTNLVIPSSVTSIGEIAFSNNNLTNLVIPSSVTSIGAYAFENNNVTNLTIPSSVTSIGAYAFENNLLTSVTINGTPTIGCDAFYGENHSTEVNALDDDAMCR